MCRSSLWHRHAPKNARGPSSTHFKLKGGHIPLGKRLNGCSGSNLRRVFYPNVRIQSDCESREKSIFANQISKFSKVNKLQFRHVNRSGTLDRWCRGLRGRKFKMSRKFPKFWKLRQKVNIVGKNGPRNIFSPLCAGKPSMFFVCWTSCMPAQITLDRFSFRMKNFESLKSR